MSDEDGRTGVEQATQRRLDGVGLVPIGQWREEDTKALRVRICESANERNDKTRRGQ